MFFFGISIYLDICNIMQCYNIIQPYNFQRGLIHLKKILFVVTKKKIDFEFRNCDKIDCQTYDSGSTNSNLDIQNLLIRNDAS